MRIAAVQYKARRGDRRASLRALVDLAREAAQGSDLVVLPEMAVTGYAFPDAAAVRRVAERPHGETFAALAPVARETRCWIVVGFPELDGDRLFNSALILDPSGALAFTYRKTLLYDADLPWATPGDSGYRRFDTDAGSFGVGICMDLNDDAFVGWAGAARLDVMALPTAWIDEELPVWPYWQMRIHGTGAWLAAANTWGAEEPGPTRFSGCSAILGGRQILATAPKQGDEILRACLPGE